MEWCVPAMEGCAQCLLLQVASCERIAEAVRDHLWIGAFSSVCAVTNARASDHVLYVISWSKEWL